MRLGFFTSTKFAMLGEKKLKRLVRYILVIQQENYVTKRKRTESQLFEMLGLTP